MHYVIFAMTFIVTVFNYVDRATQSITLVILVMSIAFSAKSVGDLGWCIVGDVSPKEAIGISGSFDAAQTYVAVMGLLGAFAYLFIVGPPKRLELNEPAARPFTESELSEPQTR